jgi:hypothetical protein
MDMDPDPGGGKKPQQKKKMLSFEVIDALF